MMVKGLISPREQVHATISFYGDSTIAVELDLFCGVRGYVALGMRFWLARHTSGRPTPHNSYQRLRRNCISATSSFQGFGGTAPRISQVASALAFISRSTSA